MNGDQSRHDGFLKVQRFAAITAVAGLIACLLMGIIGAKGFFPAYLVAFLFWCGLSLGCMAATMLHHLVGGGWGLVIRRPLEAGAATIAAMAALFVPIFFGMRNLYSWTYPDIVAADSALRHKAPYLNTGAFTLRAVGYFTIWSILAYLLNRWSRSQDTKDDETPTFWLRNLSGPGLVLWVMTVTFASIDWVMSLEPHWYSTIYGVMLFIGQGLTTLALMILLLFWFKRFEPFETIAKPSRFQDLANLMLAFVMLWAYMAFSQFLIIWSGNLSKEIPWYIRRTQGAWGGVAICLILFHFFLPFGILLFRDVKRGGKLLIFAAFSVLVMHLVDLVWLVFPAFVRTNRIMDFLALVVSLIGIGGVWFSAFFFVLKQAPLIPWHDPSMASLSDAERGRLAHE